MILRAFICVLHEMHSNDYSLDAGQPNLETAIRGKLSLQSNFIIIIQYRLLLQKFNLKY